MSGDPIDVPGLLAWVVSECGKRGAPWLEPMAVRAVGEIIAKHGSAEDVRVVVGSMLDEKPPLAAGPAPPPARRAVKIPPDWEVMPKLCRPS